MPSEDFEITDLKHAQHVRVAVIDRADTISSHTAADLANDRHQTKLLLLKGGDSVVLGKPENLQKKRNTVNAMKQKVDLFVVFDSDRKESSNWKEITMQQDVASCCDTGKSCPRWKPTADDNRKMKVKLPVKRKRLNQML